MRFVFVILALLSAPVSAGDNSADAPAARAKPVDPTSRLIGLVEYVGGDYAGAVAGGAVTSASEYAEMLEFSAAAARELDAQRARFKPADFAAIAANLDAFKALVAAKADAGTVAGQARTIRDRILAALCVDAAPAAAPKLATAAAAFGASCSTCHGATGRGDGAEGKGFEPPPRNFHEAEVVQAISPFKVFNTLHTGVDGTRMKAYDEVMDDATLWALAFYVPAWPQRVAFPDLAALAPEAAFATLSAGVRGDLASGGLSLELLARFSEPELRAWLKSTVRSGPLDAGALDRYVAVIKLAAPFVAAVPRVAAAPVAGATVAAPPPPGPPADGAALRAALAFARQKTADAAESFAAGKSADAEALLFDAYLKGYEKVERPLNIAHRDLVARTEQAFIAARAQARTGDASGFAAASAALEAALAEAAPLLEDAAPAAASTFFAAFVIILREGFEAFLVVGAILTLLAKSNAHDRKKWIHLGWISAALAGIASYFLFNELFALTGATRETIEAVCTGLAAVVLFYVSFWLLNQAERGRWDQFLRAKAKVAATGEKKIGALFLLAFIAVYREAAETVLFFVALGADAKAPGVVAAGFAAGAVVLLAVCAVIMRFGVKLPLRRFFLATSALMTTISIGLAGKAVKELVEAGYVRPTLLPGMPTLDAFGVYPYAESLAAQLFAIILAAALVWLSTRSTRSAARAAAA